MHDTRLQLNISGLNFQRHRLGCSETAVFLCGKIETAQHYLGLYIHTGNNLPGVAVRSMLLGGSATL